MISRRLEVILILGRDRLEFPFNSLQTPILERQQTRSILSIRSPIGRWTRLQHRRMRRTRRSDTRIDDLILSCEETRFSLDGSFSCVNLTPEVVVGENFD